MHTRADSMHLALFFTRGVSLQTWESLGMFGREVALYQRLQAQGVRVTFVTHGDSHDRRFAGRLPGISICCNHWGLPPHVYERLIPLLHARRLRRATLFKTNQIPGGGAALLASHLHARPLIARCGYLWSEFMERRHGADAPATRRSRATEWQVFTGAHRVVVTTAAMRSALLERFPWLGDTLRVVPNYVDTELFSPGDQTTAKERHLCYIGRLDAAQKNLGALVEAIRDLDVTLDLIGEGPLRPALEKEAVRNPRLRLLGGRPHAELPDHLRRATAFVLPSHYEGHPKTLIEAMACGMPVITTNTPGIRELVTDNETGALCAPDAPSLRARIATVLGDAPLRARLGRGARDYVVRHFALERVAAQELALYHELEEA